MGTYLDLDRLNVQTLFSLFSAACIDLGLIPLLLDTVSTSFTSVDKMSPTDCLIQDVCHFSFCFLTCSLARKENVLLILTDRVCRNNQCRLVISAP